MIHIVYLRKEEVSLDNDSETILIEDNDLLHYARIKENERIDIYLNASSNNVKIKLDEKEKVVLKYHVNSVDVLPSMSAIITKTK